MKVIGTEMSTITYLAAAIFVIFEYLLICEVAPSLLSRLFSGVQLFKVTYLRPLLEVVSVLGFVVYMNNHYKIQFLSDEGAILYKLLLVLFMTFFLFVLTDRFIDPVLGRLFVKTTVAYHENIKLFFSQGNRAIIKVCILAPIVEEIVVRGVIQGNLFNDFNPLVAIVVASLLFGALHFNLHQVLSSVIPSLVLGLIYYETQALIVCIAIHMGYNFLSLLSLRVKQNKNEVLSL